MNQYISAALIVWVWILLLVGYMAWEKYKAWRKRERFMRQLAWWKGN